MDSLCKRIISTAEVARRLDVSENRVRQLDDTLRPFFVGRTRAYDRAAVERYAASRDATRAARGAR